MNITPPSPERENPPLDVKRIVSTLDAHGVQYLLIGGLGATLYGAERVTQDIDLLPLTDVDNLSKLAAALRDLGAFLRVGGLSDDEARALPVVIDGRSLAATEVTTWRTDAGDLDVLATIRGEHGERRQYADLVDRARPDCSNSFGLPRRISRSARLIAPATSGSSGQMSRCGRSS